jgi:hypothetical protein
MKFHSILGFTLFKSVLAIMFIELRNVYDQRVLVKNTEDLPVKRYLDLNKQWELTAL